MIKVEEIETIRRAYFIEGLSIREISRRFSYCRRTIRKAIQHAEASRYIQKKPRPAPVLGPYHGRIDQLLKEIELQPRKQRYTACRIYRLIRNESFQGGESTVRHYVRQRRRAMRRPNVYLPLEFDPGKDAQMDWYEAMVEIDGERQTVQLFVMRLNHSRVRIVMAFPFQKQEAFFEGHIQPESLMNQPRTSRILSTTSLTSSCFLLHEKEVVFCFLQSLIFGISVLSSIFTILPDLMRCWSSLPNLPLNNVYTGVPSTVASRFIVPPAPATKSE